MAFDPAELASIPGRPVIGWWPSGTVDEETVLAYYTALALRPDGATSHRFVDFSAVQNFSFGYRGLEKLVVQRKVKLPDHLQINLVMMSTTPLGYGMSRMYESLMTGLDIAIHVCRSPQEAAEILDVPEPMLARPSLD